MKTRIMLTAAALTLLAGAASARSVSDSGLTSICLDPAGRTLPVTCRTSSASRVNQREDICQCLEGGEPVEVAVCPRGVKPPAEGAAFEKARRSLVRKGSLVGATYQGRPVCVGARSHSGGG